jgi:hypothetical protein
VSEHKKTGTRPVNTGSVSLKRPEYLFNPSVADFLFHWNQKRETSILMSYQRSFSVPAKVSQTSFAPVS